MLEITRWNKDAIKIEAHNPTDAAITAAISTAAEITGYKPFQMKVTIPAGSSAVLE